MDATSLSASSPTSKAAPWAIYGVFLIAFMFLMPAGISGALRLGWRRLARRAARRERA